MVNEDIQRRASELHKLIIGASTSSAWSNSAENDVLPDWQRDVLSKILALTYEQEILYLSTAMPDASDWDIIAFTDASVVQVVMTRVDGKAEHVEASVFLRSSLESLELLDVASVPWDDAVWPSELNLIGHYRSATVSLPLDKFSSPGNKRELVRLLTSLLQDISH
jgi:hypothetical protein